MKYLDNLNFDDDGLIPAIVQDIKTDEVLMMAYMNQEAVIKTIKTGYTWFWSRSRQKLWKKGESSGHVQQVEELKLDCDGDTLLVKVQQTGGACHTGHYSCFYRQLNSSEGFEAVGQKVFDPDEVYGEKESGDSEEKSGNQLVPKGGLPQILQEVYQVVLDRKENPVEDSYTCYLLDEGLDKILKKVGEEATEVVIASKNRDDEEIVAEVADLLYHLLVLLNYHEINLDQVYDELASRFKK